MFTTAALISLLASLTFAGWLADRWAMPAGGGGLNGWEKLGLVGVWGTLVALTVGLFERSRIDSPYLWIHWVIFTAVVVASVGLVGAYFAQRRR